eukprot:4216191-Prymnesium_polylepis.1
MAELIGYSGMAHGVVCDGVVGAALWWCRELWSRSRTTYFGCHCRRSDYASLGVCHTGRPPNAQLHILFE